MAHNAEYAANDPALFGTLVRSLQDYHATHGEPFFMQFRTDSDYDPAQDGYYFMNAYPEHPQELIGGNAVDAHDIKCYNLREQPDITLIEAGTEARGEALDAVGIEYGVATWLFNQEQQGKYDRIGEIAAHAIDPEGNAGPDNDIYWVEADGSVWMRHFMDNDDARRQVHDVELAEITEIVRHMDT
jgi:hypothetical protein